MEAEKTITELVQKYLDMNIWDPRYMICRYRLYAYIDVLTGQGNLTGKEGFDYITRIENKFYRENFTTRNVERVLMSLRSSFKWNSAEFFLDKVKLSDLRHVRDALEDVDYFLEQKRGVPQGELLRCFIAYAAEAKDLLLRMYAENNPKFWEIYVNVLNDYKFFAYSYTDISPQLEELREVLRLITIYYYDVLEQEYILFEDLGVSYADCTRGGDSPAQVETDKVVLLQLLQDKTRLSDLKEELKKVVADDIIIKSYKSIENFAHESVFMQIERCLNRIQDVPVLYDGLCKYTLEDLDKMREELELILDLSDERIVELAFNRYGIYLEVSYTNGNYENYMEAWYTLINLIKIFHEHGMISTDAAIGYIYSLQREGVQEMLYADMEKVRDELLEELGVFERIEVVERPAGYEVFALSGSNEGKPNQTDSSALKLMSLGEGEGQT